MRRRNFDHLRHHLCRSGKDPQSRSRHGHGKPSLYTYFVLAHTSNVTDRKHGDAHTVTKNRKSLRGKEEGSVAVEAGLILPTLLLFVIGSIEAGRALWTYQTMLLAVEEAGRYAMVYGASPSLLTTASCPSGTVDLLDCTRARANTYLSNYGATGVNVTTSQDTSIPNLTITATYTFNFVTPLLLPFGPINLSSQVIVPTI